MDIIRSVFKNMKIRVVCAMCAAMCAALIVQTVITLSFSDDAGITEAFAVSEGIVISESEAEAAAKLSFEKDNFYQNAEKLFDDVNKALNVNTPVYERDGEKMCIKAEISSERYNVSELVTWSEELENTYFHCVVSINEDGADVMAVKETLENVLDLWGAEHITYVRMDAKKSGAMDEKECEDYVKKVFMRLDAKEVYQGKEGLYTAYGYSKKLTDTITADDKLINVQVSLSYNEEQDVTEITLGYPIINTSY